MILKCSSIGISHYKASIENIYTREKEEKSKKNVTGINSFALISYFGKKIIIKSKKIMINKWNSVSYINKPSFVSDWIKKKCQ